MSDEAPQSSVNLRAELLKNEQIPIPDVLDVFVVGAGVAGTAAAFRAVELGLSTMIIDRDDILELLRSWAFDYEPPKIVDANYNAQARKTPFPQGGDLIGTLPYEDRSESPDLYQRWVGTYIQHQIPIRTGMELTGVEHHDDGTITVTCRQASETGIQFRTKAVVLAIGAGMPNTLPIPGDVGGVAATVGSGERFMGGPACVLGGGTSAAEAVIRIAGMKKEANDPAPVFWCFRSQALPKVNDTLNESLGKAMAAGNMQPIPLSNAMAVLDERVKDGDHEGTKQYVIVRTSRTRADHRPYTSDYLEFEKERVLACLGSAPQTEFLASMGIEELEVEDQDAEGMAVTPWFESARPNVYLVGEPLAPEYIQTTDFDPNADQALAVQQAACFKNSMRNGVFAVEAAAARAQGADDAALKALMLQLETQWKEGFTPDVKKAEPKKEAEAPKERMARFTQMVGDSDGVVRNMPIGSVNVLQATGEVQPGGERVAGSTHLKIQPDGVYVSDPANMGETLIQVGVERTIDRETIFMAGSQRFRIVDTGGQAMLATIGDDGAPRSMFPVSSEGHDYGRKESSTVTCIAADDRGLSRRHFRLSGDGNLFALRDYGTVNGTYVTVSDNDAKLVKGDIVWAGDFSFRYEGMEGDEDAVATAPTASAAPAPAAPAATTPAAPPAPPAAPATPEPAPAAPADPPPAPAAEPAAPAPEPAAAPAPAADGPPSLIVGGQTLDLSPDKTVLDNLIDSHAAYQTKDSGDADGKMLWSCHGAPSCYLCIMNVVSGGENLDEMGKKEKKGLKLKVAGLQEEEQFASLDKDSCRLGCMVKASGPVSVELLGNTDV